MSWNVYYANLGAASRVQGVAEGIARVAPEIASLQEMWSEKPRILEKLIQVTGQNWSFAEGGETESVWDGDILYRSDLWRLRASGLRKYGDRGLSWAALERRSDGAEVLVYGTHPPYTYPNDRPILEAMRMATEDMQARQEEHPFPVVFMGDMNAHYNLDSQRLLRSGLVHAYGLDWCAPLTFRDSYAEVHPSEPNPPSGNWPVKIDFVYFEEAPLRMGTVVGAKVWSDLPGGSDHFAVSGDVILARQPRGGNGMAQWRC